MITIVLNTEIIEFEKKIPNVTDSVRKADFEAKILEIEKKYFTTADCNKFTSKTLYGKIKQKEFGW